MRKYLFTLLLLLILCPFAVNAEEINYDLCSSNCDFQDLDTAFSEISGLSYEPTDNVTLKIKEGSYDLPDGHFVVNNFNLSIIGEGTSKTKINLSSYLKFEELNSVTVSGINFVANSTNGDAFVSILNVGKSNFKDLKFTNFKNSTDYIMDIYFTDCNIDKVYFENCDYNTGLNIYNMSNEKTNITNSDFSGPKVGINIYSVNPATSQINIDNTVLNNSDMSLVSYFTSPLEPLMLQDNNLIGNLSYVDSLIDTTSVVYITVTNSKLTGVVSGSDIEYDSVKNVVYVDYTNTWLKEISDGETVVEEASGKVYYDKVRKKIVTMEINGNKKLNDIFGVTFDENTVWDIADPEILKIEDGKIIGLKTGTTTIRAKNNLDVYTLDATILNNPKTISTIYITMMLIILVSLGTGIALTVKENKSKSVQLEGANQAPINNQTIENEVKPVVPVNQMPIEKQTVVPNTVIKPVAPVNQVPITNQTIKTEVKPVSPVNQVPITKPSVEPVIINQVPLTETKEELKEDEDIEIL